MFGEKIKTIRELRGFSQEYMAVKLDIAQNTYSKIERSQTKLSALALQKIAELLGVSPIDILSHHPVLLNFEAKAEQKQKASGDPPEFFEKLMATKDSEIEYLRAVVCSLIRERDQMLELVRLRS